MRRTLLLSILLFSLLSFQIGAKPISKPTVQTHVGMKLIKAQNLCFTMGWDREEAGTEWACFIGKHKVTFTYDFYMDTTLVTQDNYLKIMGVNPSAHSTGDLTLPVEKVSWYTAILYCNARSRCDKLDSVYTYTSIVRTKNGSTDSIIGLQCDITKNGYRLPTNSEYEYTERANQPGTYFFADSAKNADQQAETYAWSKLNSGGATHSVATKKPNQWGIYDLVGNLFEWCNDWEGPYPTIDQIDPMGPLDGKTECGKTWVGSEKKVAKGGSYKTDVKGHMRINYHFKWPPASVSPEVGFRCVATKK